MTAAAAKDFHVDCLRDPHGTLMRLRHAGELHRVSTPDGRPAWLITRYNDVAHLLTSSDVSLDPDCAHGRDYVGSAFQAALDQFLIGADPLVRQHLRSSLSGRFPELVSAVESVTKEAISDCFDGPETTVDLAADLAVSLPARVIAGLASLPPEARTMLAKTLVTKLSSESYSTTEEAIHSVQDEIGAVLTGRVPAEETLLSRLMSTNGTGDFSTSDLSSTLFFLVFGWHESMVNSLGAGIFRLLGMENRDVMTVSGQIESTVDEILRCDPPRLFAAPRYAVRDFTIADVVISRGDTLLLSLASANRDEHVFYRSSEFDPSRQPNPHLSFGRGVNLCPVAGLTRLVLRICLRTLHDTVPDLRLSCAGDEVDWQTSFAYRRPARLPVRVAPR